MNLNEIFEDGLPASLQDKIFKKDLVFGFYLATRDVDGLDPKMIDDMDSYIMKSEYEQQQMSIDYKNKIISSAKKTNESQSEEEVII
jgi:hypothetical protein